MGGPSTWLWVTKLVRSVSISASKTTPRNSTSIAPALLSSTFGGSHSRKNAIRFHRQPRLALRLQLLLGLHRQRLLPRRKVKRVNPEPRELGVNSAFITRPK